MVKAALEVLDPEKKIGTCQVSARFRFQMLVLGLATMGFGRVRVSYGRRSLDEQERLYGRGRTTAECRSAGVPVEYSCPGLSKVTWTLPHASKHVQGLAIDVWFGGYKHIQWVRVGELARLLGLTWGGDWSKRDYGHFEI